MKFKKLIALILIVIFISSNVLYLITGIDIPGIDMICASSVVYFIYTDDEFTKNDKNTKKICMAVAILSFIVGLIDIIAAIF